MPRIRLVDVAREAGVSVGAASDALAGKNRIPEDTRRRVREAAERLGYVPNRVAQALRSGRLPLIGCVIPALRRPGEFAAYRAYWGAVIGAGTLAATELGYGFVLLPGLDEAAVADLPLAAVMVVDVMSDDGDVERALGLGIPVLTEGASGDPRVAVRLDPGYRQQIDLGMDHLFERGARRIALVLPALDSVYGVEVVRAHADWCARHGHPVLLEPFDLETGSLRQALEAALAHQPDGLYLAYGVGPDIESVVAAHGRTIGDDLRVIVQDEDTDGDLTRRDITTMTFAIDGFAVDALRALVAVVEGRAEAPLTVARSFTINERASSGSPRR